MSKLLWKCLLVSPALWIATLVISVGAVRAADKASSFIADSQTPTASSQSQTAEVQTPKGQPIAIATSKTAPVAQTTQEVSTAATPELMEPKPAEVAVNPTQLTPAAQNQEALTSIPVTPSAGTAVAQVPPADPNAADVLNQINRYSREGSAGAAAQDQVTNVSQLRDVSPNDWAFEALRNLVERYGCIAGYPDGTYRGNRALTRYEFAAGLNACLQQIERLLGGQEGAVTREDFETLQRLVQEFEAELATLGTRVDNLEGRVAFLEDNQFSTTTKLSGEAIFALTDTFGGDDDDNFDFGDVDINNDGINDFNVTGDDDDTNTIFGDRVRLEFNTSFTGQDRLVTRLAAGNLDAFRPGSGTVSSTAPGGQSFDLNTGEGYQTFNFKPTGNNDVFVDWLAYYFTFGSSRIYLAATGGIHSDYAPTLNPYFEDFDGGNGALSIFASESPIYRIGGGAGGAISLGVGPLESILGPSTLTVGYLAGPGAEDPSEDNGVFNGEYSVLGQLNFNLGDRIGIGATYVHAYHNSGSDIFDGGTGDSIVGTFAANRPGAIASLLSGGLVAERPTVTNSYGVELAFRLSDNISISGYGAYTDAILIGRGGAEIWTYGAGVAISDLGKEGNVLGIFGGAQPYLGNTDTPGEDFRRGDTENIPFHIEAFYKYQLTDNISVTPGVIWLTAPNQGGDDTVIGTLRTTFRF